MNISEFKAFIQGFCVAIDKAPTEKQWKMILEKIESLELEVGTSFVPQQKFQAVAPLSTATPVDPSMKTEIIARDLDEQTTRDLNS